MRRMEVEGVAASARAFERVLVLTLVDADLLGLFVSVVVEVMGMDGGVEGRIGVGEAA